MFSGTCPKFPHWGGKARCGRVSRRRRTGGCRPEEIFFVDDIPGHVEGAKAVGIDAIVYSSAAQVAAELRAEDCDLIIEVVFIRYSAGEIKCRITSI